MKIAFVSDAIFPYNKGGKETRLLEISSRLSKKGHDIHIYCMKWWDGSVNKKENGVHLHSICKYVPLYTNSETGKRSIFQALYFGFSCFKLFKEKFDVIDVDHMPFFPLFPIKLTCISKNKKMFGTWHEVWGKNYWQKYLGWKGIFGYAVERLSVLMPNKIISVSRTTTSKLKNDLNVKKKIYTVSNGIDFDKIQKVKPAKEKFDVIYAGRLLEHKNVDVLIKSIKLIKENFPVKCLIIGEGPEEEKLITLTKKLKLETNIKFLGFLKNSDDVYSLMKSSKVFALLSTREGFGLVALEANACGLPVITIDHKDNSAKDLISNNNNGFIYNLDEKEIAEGIVKAIKGSSYMKQFCIESVQKYYWDEIVNEIEEVYAK